VKMQALSRLVAPLAYLRVTHPTKRVYDYWLPLCVGSIAAAVIVFGGVKINVFGEYGTVHGINQLLQLLVGFYVAALAAVATFNGEHMDEFTAGDPLYLGDAQLTRRRFVCLLFGHLAVVGFLLYTLGVFAMAAAPGVRDALAGSHVAWWLIDVSGASIVRAVFTWLHLVISAHLFVVTLYGVYFLAVRMHTIPAKPTIKPPPLKQVA
jgi:hypothetical protein